MAKNYIVKELINEMKENTKVRKFVIPNYISNALDFIEGVDTK